MRRLSAVLTIALLAVAANATTASAAPIDRVPVGNGEIFLPSALFCGFDVDINVVADNEFATTTTLADGTVVTHVTGRFVESYTNVSTGKTIIRNVSGPTTTTQPPNSTTATFQGAGNNRLIFGPGGRANTGEPALVITSGLATVTFTGNTATSFSLAGTQENICATLAAP